MKVHQRWDRFRAVDAGALFVVHDDPATVRELLLGGREDAGLPFPLLVDRDRETYVRWGCSRTSRWRLWLDPQVWRRYWDLLRSGMRLRGTGSDTLQLGGDFVVAPDGTVAYSRPQARDDRPPVGELIEWLEAVAPSQEEGRA